MKEYMKLVRSQQDVAGITREVVDLIAIKKSSRNELDTEDVS
jgi:hypothetical protein